jgi:hypothetical protein
VSLKFFTLTFNAFSSRQTLCLQISLERKFWLRSRDDEACNFSAAPSSPTSILADEINRTPPKNPVELSLEAMQEHQVTAAGKRYPLPEPFFVLATQNPIEMEGTYPLPEPSSDRFMFNVLIDYLPYKDELQLFSKPPAARHRRLNLSSRAKTSFDSKDSCAVCRSPRKSPATPYAWPPQLEPDEKKLPTSSING